MKRPPLVKVKASLSEAAETKLEQLAEAHGCYRSRYAGLLLEGLLEALARMRPLERQILLASLLGEGTALQRRRSFVALQHSIASSPREQGAQGGPPARRRSRAA